MVRFYYALYFFIALAMFTSCVNTQKITYFKNVPDKTFAAVNKPVDVPIRPNDILSITVTSLNAEASAAFNLQVNNVIRATTATGQSSESGGYLVNSDGNIDLPMLGTMKAAGLTKVELKDRIVRLINSKKLLIDPIVDIRFLNFEVTVIGEVAKPTVITVPNEKMSLLKAIGLAGDLTIYGKRENILLIRDENGVKVTRHIDLTSPNFFNSPYYYLEPNDVIYVEPNKTKAATSGRSQQLVPIIFSALSFMAIIVDRLVK
jgi:polysaccharide biosynthesis/export protein